MDVGVRELKQHLSRYLDRVAAGETIRVTDRGVPKAIISPLRRTGALERGVDEGWVRAPKRVGLQPVAGASSERTTRDVLNDDRG